MAFTVELVFLNVLNMKKLFKQEFYSLFLINRKGTNTLMVVVGLDSRKIIIIFETAVT